MHRFHLAFISSLVVAALAACSPVEVGSSLCESAANAAACETKCDPRPGVANMCPTGFHCAPDGFCDARCTAGGGECGDGYTCSADGRCEPSNVQENGPDATCPAVVFQPKVVTPSIQLLLDRSGSMAANDISPTRYNAMRAALTGPNGVVTQLQGSAYFGSQLYGCADANTESNIFVPRARNNASAIDASIGSISPSGNTPTPGGVNAAVASFQANPPPADSPPAIVLATDGLPNLCPGGVTTEAQSVQAVRNAYTAGIPVYVLAINQTSQHFQDLANAGQGWQPGQPNVTYYPVNSASQLSAAFQSIINNVLTCDLSLTSSIDPSRAMGGTVTVNGTTYTYGAEWKLVGNNNIIRLEGIACTNLKSRANSTVSAQFPCGSVIF